MKSPIVQDGFLVRGQEFPIPPDSISLDPETKREVTICNLFVNHKLTVPEIIRVLDEDHRHIVSVLLDYRIVRERRQKHRMPPEGIERRRSGN